MSLTLFAKILQRLPMFQCLQKAVWDFFLFCLYHELLAKIQKGLVFAHLQKPSSLFFYKYKTNL